MIEIEGIKKIYFIGIGGIGMSALARYFQHQGKKIYGYDKTKTELTKKLEAEGMKIHYEIDLRKIPKKCDLVIYTPAISLDNEVLQWCMESGIPVVKRAEALGWLSSLKRTYAIGGTHGKTTTSAVLAHILNYCNTGASALIGGLMVDYGGNFIFSDGDILVTEADEYDRSFLHLDLERAAIMSMDADHLDIYETTEELIEGFEQYSLRLRPNGTLFLKHGLISKVSRSIVLEWNERGYEIYDFGDEDARIYVTNERVEEGRYHFDITFLGELYEGFSSSLPGSHNAENISVAFAMAMMEDLDVEKIKEAISVFSGISRRFEMVLEKDEVTIIDDYAHHPTEIAAAIETGRKMYPEKKMTVIFQPHLYSRTRDFSEEFAKELSKADELILTEIYPAREKPIEGVTSEIIFENVNIEQKSLVAKSELLRHLIEGKHELIMILGAGDIDKKVKKIKKLYNI